MPRSTSADLGDELVFLNDVGQEALAIDIANLKADLAGREYTDVFMSAALPTGLAEHDDEYYSTRDEFVTAHADATREEYQAIIDSDFLIQLDDPLLRPVRLPARGAPRAGGVRRFRGRAARRPIRESGLPVLTVRARGHTTKIDSYVS